MRHSSTRRAAIAAVSAMTVPHVIPASLLLPKVARAGPVAVTFLHTPAAHSWSLGQTLPQAPHCITWQRVEVVCCILWDFTSSELPSPIDVSQLLQVLSSRTTPHHLQLCPHIVSVTLHVGALLFAQAVCIGDRGTAGIVLQQLTASTTSTAMQQPQV